MGFHYQETEELLNVTWSEHPLPNAQENISLFLEALEEEKFQRQYFWHIPLERIQSILE